MQTLEDSVAALSRARTQRAELFCNLPQHKRSRVFLLLAHKVQQQLLRELPEKELLALFERLDPDEVTDALQLLSKKEQEQLMVQLTESLRQSVALLLRFDAQTAAGIMNVDYIQVEASDRIEFVIDRVKKYEAKTGKMPTILVLADGLCIGQIPASKLIFADGAKTAQECMRKIPTIDYGASHTQVLQLLRKSARGKVVVLGEHDSILGVIYSHDVLAVINEQKGSSLSKFAGVAAEESIYDSIATKTNFRYKWLLINLGTSFLAAATVSLFESTISKNVLLAVYMPIVAGMGGNAGTQTLAVMVRGLSQVQANSALIWETLKSEVGAGFLSGVLNGLVIAAVIMLINADVVVAITLGLAMVFNLVIAATFGTLVPFAMKKIGKDPASSATIFITTATDVFGFIFFLGLATALLR